MTMFLMLAAMILCACSGLPGLLFRRGRKIPQRVATVLHLLGCAAGLGSAFTAFSGMPAQAIAQWPLPGGSLQLHVDALSAFFLVPVFLIAAAGSVYGEGYWPEALYPQNGRKLRFFYGILTASLGLVMIAGDAWSFLAGWEIVGLAAFFLITTEQENAEARRAGWIYLIAAHAGTLILFAMFGLLRVANGSWLLVVASNRDPALIAPILILALIGFGIKAGVMPFHVWLPEAHAAAPSHISAILSGVVLKMGIYGLIRVISILPLQEWFGLTLLTAGIVSGVLGVAFALAQHDLKRLLAYHSIENIGIILIGIGVGVLGAAAGQPGWAALGFAGGLLHVWNHALFKSLLFYSAGSVIHSTGTRAIDAMGGLFRRMRFTALSFLIGAVAISGLPPLNGFVSEWFIYLAGFRAVLSGIPHPASGIGHPASNLSLWSALAVPALALIGALAVACFVKVFSVVFLGSSRSIDAEKSHEAPVTIRVAMAVLAVACLVIGLWPIGLHSVLTSAVSLLPGVVNPDQEIARSLAALPAMAFLLIAVVLVLSGVAARLVRGRRTSVVTWDCGYAAPDPRMQYTASSFADSLTGLFRWALFPDERRSVETTLFPSTGSFDTHVPDPVLDRVLVPGVAKGKRLMALGRFIQAGRVQIYILYVLLALVILLAWSVL
jgi:hydrogenase-4 component B